MAEISNRRAETINLLFNTNTTEIHNRAETFYKNRARMHRHEHHERNESLRQLLLNDVHRANGSGTGTLLVAPNKK